MLDGLLKVCNPVLKRGLPAHPIRDVEAEILVFEPFLLGDFMMATPAFRFLRKHFPAARIDCVGPPFLAGLEPFFPWLDEIIPFHCPWSPQYRDYSRTNLMQVFRLAARLRQRRYDWAFDLRGDLRDIIFLYTTGASRRAAFGITGAKELLTDVIPFDGQPFSHQVEGNVLVVSQPFSVSPEQADFYPSMSIPAEWRQAAAQWLADRGIRHFIAVNPGAALAHKRWPASLWVELLEGTVLPRCPVVVFGTESESPTLDEIIGRLKPRERVHRAHVPLPLFFSLVSVARGLITLDSGAGHVGAAAGVPVVSLHGPGPPALSGPYSPVARAVYLTDVPCRPCLRACTQPRNFCILDLPVKMVSRALENAGIL